jgi:O-antigen ligase
VTLAVGRAESGGSTLFNRKRYLQAFALLLAAGLTFDPSIYVGGLTHVYVHDLTTFGVLALGLVVMQRTRSALLPPALYVPLGLLIFLAVDTIVLGAVNYPRAPAIMHKLFWFEHLDALRILGELAVWVWAFGQLRPSGEEGRRMFDIALWGGAAGLTLTGAWFLIAKAPHVATTSFDLTVMVGLPMSLVFVLRRGQRADWIRLAVFGAACLLLYSRTAMVVIAFSLVVVLLAARDWHKSIRALALVVGGGLLVLLVSFAAGSAGLLPRQALVRFISIAADQLVPYTIPGRVAIWKDAAHMFTTNPLLGVGYHDYFLYSHVSEVKNGTSAAPADLPGGLIKQAHNDFLSMLAETGLVGTAIFLGFWFLSLRAAYRLWRDDLDNRIWHAFTASFLVSLLGVSLVGEVLIPRTPDWVAPAALWWILIGFVFLQLRERADAIVLPVQSC